MADEAQYREHFNRCGFCGKSTIVENGGLQSSKGAFILDRKSGRFKLACLDCARKIWSSLTESPKTKGS